MLSLILLLLLVMDLQNNTVASGGLGREVFIWDLEAATVPVARAHNEGNEDGSYEGGYASGEFWQIVFEIFFLQASYVACCIWSSGSLFF